MVPAITAWRCAILSCAALMGLSGIAAAQVPPAQLPPSPGAVQQQNIELQRKLLEEERRRSSQETPGSPLDTRAIEKPEKPPGQAPSLRFLLKRIEFSPSEILSKQELDDIAAQYQGKEVTFAELQSVVAKVNALYRAKGVINAEAVLPPQDVSGGVVMVRLVEGRIGRYNLDGAVTTREKYVLGRMHAPIGSLLDLKTLERDLIWFNRTNDVQLRAELKPGGSFGTTDVELKLTEPGRHALHVFTDNSGGKSVGENRIGLIYQNRSLLGYRDELTVSTTRSEGDEGAALSYALPVNTWGGRLQIGYNQDRTKIKNGPFASLDISGTATAWSGTFRQPFYVTAANKLEATLGYAERSSTTWVSNVQLPKIDTADITVGLDGNRLDVGGTWTGNLNFTSGHASKPVHVPYTILRGFLRRDQDLPGSFRGRINLSGQSTNFDLLPGSEQLYIGGAGTVRGYSNLAYGGNSGYVANAELHHAVPTFGVPNVNVSGFVFFDHGETKPVGPGLNTIMLQSVGFGADFAIYRRVFGHLTFGHQLRDKPQEPRNYRIDFSLVMQVF